jgi:Protein kinase domain
MGFVLDVADYGARPAPQRSDVQRRLPVLVATMLGDCGIELESVEHEWTGDGINVVLPADTDPTVALPVLLRTLAALLGEDNARSVDAIRLRMSVGIGLVENSAAGFGGPMIIELSRLVDSAPLRAALAAYPSAHLAVAISDHVYTAIIRPGYPGIPGTQFTRVEVAEKEFRAPAWIWISTRQWTVPAFGPLGMGDPRTVGGSGTHRYRLVARLGAGRASTVYLGRHSDGLPVAVKVFRPEAVAGSEGRFRLAAGVKAAASVSSPRTVRITDANADADQPWIAMPLVPGPSLEEAVAQTGPLPVRSALWLAAGVARGLLDIHTTGLVHGSLRPSNVLLSPGGPVVTDAGTGWAVLTGVPHAEGTWANEGHGLDDDVLALGCVAFFAATGRTPYGEYPASGHHFPRAMDDPDWTGCPPALLPIVRACLQPPSQRPPVAALLTDLEEAAGPMPRTWLPPAVAARLADYQATPGPRRPSGRRAPHPRTSGLLTWLACHRQ